MPPRRFRRRRHAPPGTSRRWRRRVPRPRPHGASSSMSPPGPQRRGRAPRRAPDRAGRLSGDQVVFDRLGRLGDPCGAGGRRSAHREVSPFLVHDLQWATRSSCTGPLGAFFVWRPPVGAEPQRPVQLIAGGSGVVPLYAMASAHDAAGRHEFRMLYSVRTPDDVFFRPELTALRAPGSRWISSTPAGCRPAGPRRPVGHEGPARGCHRAGGIRPTDLRLRTDAVRRDCGRLAARARAPARGCAHRAIRRIVMTRLDAMCWRAARGRARVGRHRRGRTLRRLRFRTEPSRAPWSTCRRWVPSCAARTATRSSRRSSRATRGGCGSGCRASARWR